MADGCSSLESLGDILNCKWLWKVSVLGDNKLGPHFGDILLDSMLQGNALEDHFISVGLFRDQMIPKRFVGRLYNGDRFTKHLPDDWYNDFCGFLICVATPWEYPCINIVITHEANDDSPSELCIEAPDPTYNETIKFVGYVSFSSLRLFTSSYKSISFYLEFLDHPNHVFDDCFVGAELVPKKSKVDKVQATNCSEFWDKEYEHTTFTITTFTTFTMQHDSQIYFNILWQPYYETKLAKLHVVVDVQNDNGKMKAMRAVYKCRGVMFVHVSVEHKFLAVTGTVFDMDKILKKLRKYWPARLVSYKNAVGW